MDFSRPEDQMDLASSPARLSDDIDLELDDFRDASPLPSTNSIANNHPKQSVFVGAPAPLSTDNTIEDQAMSDDEVKPHEEAEVDNAEHPMTNGHSENGAAQIEEDFLYDDDEDLGYDLDADLDADLEHSEEHQHGKKQFEAENQGENMFANETELEIGTKPEVPSDDMATKSGETEDLLHDDGNTDIVQALETDTYQTDVAHTGADFHSASPKLESSNAIDNEDGENFIGDLTEAVEGHKEVNHTTEDPQAFEHDDYGLEDEEQFDAKQGAEEVHSGAQTVQAEAQEADSSARHNSYARTALEDVSQHPATNHDWLHPVKVQYLENWMSLFPTTAEQDGDDVFFLDDVNLAHETLDRMLCACRDVLADSIDVHDELVLDVPSLGLHISEGSRHASQISLSQILEVYIALANNEETGHIKPLACSIRSRVSSSSQYAYMQSFAKEGKTLTAFVEENEDYVDGGEGGNSGHTPEITNDQQSEIVDVGERSENVEDSNDKGLIPNVSAEDSSAAQPLTDIAVEKDFAASAPVGDPENAEELLGPADNHQIAEKPDEDIFENVAEAEQAAGDDVLDLNLRTGPEQIESEIESNFQESLSSNTVEADNELGRAASMHEREQSVLLDEDLYPSAGQQYNDEEEDVFGASAEATHEYNEEDVIVDPAAEFPTGDGEIADAELDSLVEAPPHLESAPAITETEGDDDLLDYDTDNEEAAEVVQGQDIKSSTPGQVNSSKSIGQKQVVMNEVLPGQTSTNTDSLHHAVANTTPKSKGLAQSTEGEAQGSAIKLPTTPPSDKKRKVLDDDDDFDLLDLDSPEKKRGRAS